MGIWKSARGQGSDCIVTCLHNAFSKIAKECKSAGSEYTLNDLADGIEFATRGFLKVEINPELDIQTKDIIKISEIGREDLLTIPNRGQIISVKERIEANYRESQEAK